MAQGKGNPEINKKVATSALVTLLVSVVGFYLGNRYWEAVASLGGQFFEHWGDGFALMWPLIAENPAHIDMSPNAMLAGLTMCVLVWLFWLRYVAFVGNFRAGEGERFGTLGHAQGGQAVPRPHHGGQQPHLHAELRPRPAPPQVQPPNWTAT